ncbi:N-acetylmuramoyl-L-alanine amidase [Providencia rettgeri]|uniref:N-acetylmuramoyl-L-alanine amidase n=2 Tax=Providencia rettgeri TaxID=587 RepID=UPI0023613C22|nr:N-acetylmuramoyl-L-alanine amidase [Providencia rettgeri]
MLKLDYNTYRSIKGFNRRVRFLVMHYTALNFQNSVNALSGNGTVSAHYLVPDPTDITFHSAGFDEMIVFNLVDEHERAFHAGVSTWAGRSNLNDSSIGIEIVNEAKDNNGHFIFPPYDAIQIDAVKKLALNIIARYPDISPTNIVGHSDIAPGRKSDPGAAFPWKSLYEAGIGAWYDDDTKEKYKQKYRTVLPSKADILEKLKQYGYDISMSNTESGYQMLLRAFQLHFRQENYDGIADLETIAILYALTEKYFS